MRKRSQSRVQSQVKSQPPLISKGTLENKPHLILDLLNTRELGFYTVVSIISYGLPHRTKFQVLKFFTCSGKVAPVAQELPSEEGCRCRGKPSETKHAEPEGGHMEQENGIREGSSQNTEASRKRPKFRIHPPVCRS